MRGCLQRPVGRGDHATRSVFARQPKLLCRAAAAVCIRVWPASLVPDVGPQTPPPAPPQTPASPAGLASKLATGAGYSLPHASLPCRTGPQRLPTSILSQRACTKHQYDHLWLLIPRSGIAELVGGVEWGSPTHRVLIQQVCQREVLHSPHVGGVSVPLVEQAADLHLPAAQEAAAAHLP